MTKYNYFLDIDTIGFISQEELFDLSIVQAVIMIGSNDNAKQNLIFVKTYLKKLSWLTDLLELSYIIGDDHTKKSSAIYHNQAIVITFDDGLTGKFLYSQLKKIEIMCGRDYQKNNKQFNYLVAMDLDILAVNFSDNLQQMSTWAAIKERYPFKTHELACLILPKLIGDNQ